MKNCCLFAIEIIKRVLPNSRNIKEPNNLVRINEMCV